MTFVELVRMYHRFLDGLSDIRHTQVVAAMREYAAATKQSIKDVHTALKESIPFQEIQMNVLSFCFCKDLMGNFGLVRSFDHGYLNVQFDNGVRRVRPCDLIFP